jgi:triphosphoribosyl-dephospho-CoA synthase
MQRLSADEISDLFLTACRAELHALKPGNVHIYAGGHDMELEHFEESAQAAAPWIAVETLKVGERILRAVETSMAAADCNTNLGILLLCAPLAAAAELASDAPLQARLVKVLEGLDDNDAKAVFAAIRRAAPGGLGKAPEQDVSAAPTASLLESMRLAADRDRIANAYVTKFADIFDFGLPTLAAAQRRTTSVPLAVTTLHMAFLAQHPDSHIARKYGQRTAEQVAMEAADLEQYWSPVAQAETLEPLLAFDAELKARGLNPGTTADFVVATLFAAALDRRFAASDGA